MFSPCLKGPWWVKLWHHTFSFTESSKYFSLRQIWGDVTSTETVKFLKSWLYEVMRVHQWKRFGGFGVSWTSGELRKSYLISGNWVWRYSGVHLFMMGRANTHVLLQPFSPSFICEEVVLIQQLLLQCFFYSFSVVLNKKCHAGLVRTGSSWKNKLGSHNILQCL